MHSFFSLSEEAGGMGCYMLSTEDSHRLQAALSRMREDIHHAACMQPHVAENSWVKLKHGFCASTCKIPRAIGSFFKGSLRQWRPGKGAWLRDCGKNVFGSCVQTSGFAGSGSAWGQEAENKGHSQQLWRKQLEREPHRTVQSVFWHQHSRPLLCHVQTYSCLGDCSLGFMDRSWQPGK